jgi:uncharacterized protein YbjT (DUF2867 family)
MPITSNLAAPLVVVVGSTGNQGGSVIQALAESDREYRIRGLTRDVTKPAAQKLAGEGVEMVNVSLTVENADAARTAFAGADIAFVSFHLHPCDFQCKFKFIEYRLSQIFGNIATKTG